MSIAFFDLDQTLIATNSARLWIRREVALGQLSKTRAARALAWLVGYELGLAPVQSVVGRGIASLAGTRSDDLRERTRTFFDGQIRPLFRPGARLQLVQSRDAHKQLVLLTSSSNYIAELVMAELGLDGTLCNTLEVDSAGFHTGRTVGPVCFGSGKLWHAVSYAARHGVSLDDCSFFTDSFSDLPVLEKVGQPVAVNPDPRLKRLAQKRGWEVVDWGVPTEVARNGRP